MEDGVSSRDFEIHEFEQREVVWSSAIIIIICILGLFANVFVVFVILVLKEHKKAATHWYVLQLALADFLFLLLLPFKASQKLNNSWIFSEEWCKAQESLFYINYYASILFLTIMSLDRYVAVCHSRSTKLQNLRKPVVSYIVTIIVWVIAILTAIPVMINTDVVGTSPHCTCRSIEERFYENFLEGYFDSDPGSRSASGSDSGSGSGSGSVSGSGSGSGSNPESGSGMMVNISSGSGEFGSEIVFDMRESVSDDERISAECKFFSYPFGFYAFIWYNFAAMFLVPTVVMSVCYGLIIHRIIATALASSSKMDKDRKRITYMCIILVVVFIWNWAWFHTVLMAKINGIDRSHEVCSMLTEIGSLLGFSNSALNPILYIFLGTGFLKKWKAIQEAPAMRFLITLKTRSTEFFSRHQTRSRSKSMENSGTQLQRSRGSTAKDSSQPRTMIGKTKQTAALNSNSSTKA